jgi:hypothetical protein
MHEEVTMPTLDYPKELVSEIPVESKQITISELHSFSKH